MKNNVNKMQHCLKIKSDGGKQGVGNQTVLALGNRAHPRRLESLSDTDLCAR
jgi:hypothetical protein